MLFTDSIYTGIMLVTIHLIQYLIHLYNIDVYDRPDGL